ncbi:MAG: hypothetical protein JJU22_14730 [Gammaproteobacteria bacterium]|nr:hypothetical protein [Gammaproteobacteria bacterium]
MKPGFILGLALLAVAAAVGGGYLLLSPSGESPPEAAPEITPEITTRPHPAITPIDLAGLPRLRRLPPVAAELASLPMPPTPPPAAPTPERRPPPRLEPRPEPSPGLERVAEAQRVAAAERVRGPQPLQDTDSLQQTGPLQQVGSLQDEAPFNRARPLAAPTAPADEALAAALKAEGDEKAERETVRVRRVGMRRPDGRVIEARIVRNDHQAGAMIRQWLASANVPAPPPGIRVDHDAAAQVHREMLRASGLLDIHDGRIDRNRHPVAPEIALIHNHVLSPSLFQVGCADPNCGVELRPILPRSRFTPLASVLHLGAIHDVRALEAQVGVAQLDLNPRLPQLERMPFVTQSEVRGGPRLHDRVSSEHRQNLEALGGTFAFMGPGRAIRKGRTPLLPQIIEFQRVHRGHSIGDVRRFYGPIYGLQHGALLPAGQ